FTVPSCLRPTATGALRAAESLLAVISSNFLLQNTTPLKFFLVVLMPQEQRPRPTADITRMLERGELVHNVAQSFDLGAIVAAHEAVESGKAMGNIVVRIA